MLQVKSNLLPSFNMLTHGLCPVNFQTSDLGVTLSIMCHLENVFCTVFCSYESKNGVS